MSREEMLNKLNGRKVGVVVPCHNYGRYLERCLASIMNQFHAPAKVIVVDDSSTDNIKEIVDRLPLNFQYERVEYRHANKSRNHGAALLKDCDFLLFFDADNYMQPDMIEVMLKALLRDEEASYVYCDRIIVDDEEVMIKPEYFPEFSRRRFEHQNFVDFASMMYREMYDAVGGLVEDEAFYALEDWDFFYAAANAGYSGKHIAQALYFYRYHPDSKSMHLKTHPQEFQKLRDLIIDRNNVNKCPEKSVSFVFAAKTEEEARKTVEELKKQQYHGSVEYCYSTEGTIPEALNKALAMAKNEAVVFVETDVLPHDTFWLKKLLSSLDRGSMVFSDEITHVWYSWAGSAVHREDLGGLMLDENYPVAEDTEYFERLKQRGLVMKRSNAVVYHVKEHETEKALERARTYGYLHAKLLDKYQYYPKHAYKRRIELQKQIAEQTLLGMQQYENEKS